MDRRSALLATLATLASLLLTHLPAAAAPAAPAPATPSLQVRLVPATARQGDTVVVFVAGTLGARDAEGSLAGHHLAFFPYGPEPPPLPPVPPAPNPATLPRPT